MTAQPSQNGIEIRKFNFTDEDYANWVNIGNATVPDYARTPSEVRSWDDKHDPKCERERWILSQNGKAIARSTFYQFPWTYHPRKYYADIMVVPEAQGTGVGAFAYDYLIDNLQERNPLSLRCKLREDWSRSHRFARERGFEEDFREWESRLNVETFDATPFVDRYQEPEKHGIVIKPLRQWKEERTDIFEAWFIMDQEATADVPSPEPITFLPFEQWVKHFDNNPNMLDDAIFLAVDTYTNEVAGVTSLWKRQTDTDLETGFTGVRPSQRRKGIAFALKLRAIEYAKSVNCPTIRTDNASINRPMLSINEALGFEKQPAWIELVKTISTQ